jgi:hypothetical protein
LYCGHFWPIVPDLVVKKRNKEMKINEILSNWTLTEFME